MERVESEAEYVNEDNSDRELSIKADITEDTENYLGDVHTPEGAIEKDSPVTLQLIHCD